MARHALIVGLIALAGGLWAMPAYAGTVASDFDGDGLSDLAVGIPLENVGGISDAGAVEIIYGARTGPSAVTGYQFLSQETSGIADAAEADDHFGWSVASGDFNGDGFADLAIGVPGENLNVGMPPVAISDTGVVHVVYGSPEGLNPFFTPMSQTLTDVPTSPTESEASDQFGFSLATANFGFGSRTDLAVGVPGETISVVGMGAVGSAGQVRVFYGKAAGLDLTSDEIDNDSFHQARGDVVGQAGAVDNFGYTLAAANFGKSGHADLAVGVPGEDLVGAANAGAVAVLYGGRNGLSTAGDQLWTQNSPGIRDSADGGDRLGATLAAANFGKSSHADLAVSVVGEGIGAASSAGAVNVIYGSRSGLASGGNQFWHQNSPGIVETAESFNGFGWALTAANFGKSTQADLAIGSYESVGVVGGAGAVNVIYGTATGLSSRGDQLWHQDRSGIEDTAEAGDQYGQSLAAANFGHSSHADLAVGIRNEQTGAIAAAGAVSIIYGTSSGLSSAGDEFLNQDSPGVPDAAEATDFFGWSLSPRNGGLGSSFAT